MRYEADGPRYELHIRAEAGGSAFAVLHGDVHIRAGRPVYLIEPFPLSAQPGSPGTGHPAVLEALGAWRDSDLPGISVALAYGEAERNTRPLVARFAAESVSFGWTVRQGRRPSGPAEQALPCPRETRQRPLLVVVNVEQWPADDLLLLLQNPLLRTPPRTRVLFVCGTPGPWWPSLRHRLGKAGIDPGPTLALAAPQAADGNPWSSSTVPEATGGAG